MKVLTKERMEEIYRRNCDMIYRVCLLQLQHEQVFEDICEKCEKRKTHRFPKIAVAACILAVAVPTVGIAGEKISAYVMSLKKDQMHAVFQISDSADEGTGEQKVALEYVKLNVTDLVGYTREQDKGLDEMKKYAEILSKGLPFRRISGYTGTVY